MSKTTGTYSATPAFPFPTSLSREERERMEQDTQELVEILSWQRPHESEAEAQFVSLFVDDLEAHQNVSAFDVDGYGNRWITVAGPQAQTLLFSCHTDSMAAKGGRQAIGWHEIEKDTLALVVPKAGRCLGADDGAGLWLLRQMIGAGVSGTYVFHRGEEKGRLGSRYVAQHEPHRLDNFRACIAFDRRDTDNLITHQMGERCASEAFSRSLADALFYASNGDLRYQSDPTGSYTDSYSYRETIEECCNLSVGYDREHGPRETLDAKHIWRLAQACTKADWSSLRFERDPTEVDFDGYTFGYGTGTWPNSHSRSDYGRGTYLDDDFWNSDPNNPRSGDPFGDEIDTMTRLARLYPEAAASLLVSLGIDAADFCESLTETELGSANRFIMK